MSKLKQILEALDDQNDEYKILFHYSDGYVRYKIIKGAFDARQYYASVEKKWDYLVNTIAPITKSPNNGNLRRISLEYEGKTIKSSNREEARANAVSGDNDKYLGTPKARYELKVYRNGVGKIETTAKSIKEAKIKALRLFRDEDRKSAISIDTISIIQDGKVLRDVTKTDYLNIRDNREKHNQMRDKSSLESTYKVNEAAEKPVQHAVVAWYSDGKGRSWPFRSREEALARFEEIRTNDKEWARIEARNHGKILRRIELRNNDTMEIERTAKADKRDNPTLSREEKLIGLPEFEIWVYDYDKVGTLVDTVRTYSLAMHKVVELFDNDASTIRSIEIRQNGETVREITEVDYRNYRNNGAYSRNRF